MRILPRIGLDEVRFGMSREQVRALLGEPDLRSADEHNKDLTEAWSYRGEGIKASFDAFVGWRLVELEVTSPEVELCGRRVLGLPVSEVLPLLTGLTVDRPADPMDPISVEEWDMSLWFEDGVLECVQWAVPLEDDGGEIWPE